MALIPMISIVTKTNTVLIPAEIVEQLGIKPGSRLRWQLVEGDNAAVVKVIPSRGELARRLLGAGKDLSPDRAAVDELIAERTAQG